MKKVLIFTLVYIVFVIIAALMYIFAYKNDLGHWSYFIFIIGLPFISGIVTYLISFKGINFSIKSFFALTFLNIALVIISGFIGAHIASSVAKPSSSFAGFGMALIPLLLAMGFQLAFIAEGMQQIQKRVKAMLKKDNNI